MSEVTPAGLRTFGLMWFGQLVSLAGSTLTRFALGVWVYERTGSATQFALITLFAFVPGLLAAPFAGALVDRWDRRWTLFWSALAPGPPVPARAPPTRAAGGAVRGRAGRSLGPPLDAVLERPGAGPRRPGPRPPDPRRGAPDLAHLSSGGPGLGLQHLPLARLRRRHHVAGPQAAPRTRHPPDA